VTPALRRATAAAGIGFVVLAYETGLVAPEG
jgi:hypothetical protein